MVLPSLLQAHFLFALHPPHTQTNNHNLKFDHTLFCLCFLLYILILFFFFPIFVSFGSFLSFINPLLPTLFCMNGYLLTKEYYLETTPISITQFTTQWKGTQVCKWSKSPIYTYSPIISRSRLPISSSFVHSISSTPNEFLSLFKTPT